MRLLLVILALVAGAFALDAPPKCKSVSEGCLCHMDCKSCLEQSKCVWVDSKLSITNTTTDESVDGGGAGPWCWKGNVLHAQDVTATVGDLDFHLEDEKRFPNWGQCALRGDVLVYVSGAGLLLFIIFTCWCWCKCKKRRRKKRAENQDPLLGLPRGQLMRERPKQSGYKF